MKHQTMQKIFVGSVIFLLVIFSFSCRKNFDVIPGNADFRVEKDTVLMDSVFTNISSRTYNVKIYNTSDNDISLKSVHLEQGNNSFYRLNVDGEAGKSVKNVMIHAKDSIYVFIEVTADIDQLSSPIYEDKIIVEDRGKTDEILLVSFIKDAYFLYPKRFPDGRKDSLTVYTDPDTGEKSKVAGYFLNNDTTFTATKPIVVYGHVAVPDGKTLTIEQDAHLYFHFNSGLIVWKNATLKVNGTLGHEVIFEDDRMEEAFEHKSGMWNYIWLMSNSKNNEINYAFIKNAEVGIIAHPSNDANPMLRIKNTKLFNHSLVGIYALATNIEGENLVINNTGLSAINLSLGGKYDFKHCTFVNFSNGIRNEKSAAVYVNNYLKTKDEIYVFDLERFNLSNCIVDGSNSIEFFLDKNPNADFNYRIRNSAIKFNDPRHVFADVPEVDFSDIAHYQNVMLNQNMDFWNPEENILQIGSSSTAINQGDISTAQQVPLDILGVDRTQSPDLGAYQHAEKPD